MPAAARSPEFFQSLPIVDVSALLDPSAASLDEVVDALRRAASEVGFLYVTGHGIAAERVAVADLRGDP